MASVKSQGYLEKKRSTDNGCPSYKRQRSDEIKVFERQDSGMRTLLANTLAVMGVESPGTDKNCKEDSFTRLQEKSQPDCISLIPEQNGISRPRIEPTTGSHENDVNGFGGADGVVIDRGTYTVISENDRSAVSVDTFTKETQSKGNSCAILGVVQKAVTQGIDTVQDFSDEIVHTVEEVVAKVVHREQSVEELPSNNVNLRHPYGYAEPLSFGVHIIQCGRGMQIKRLLEDGFAKSAKLMEGDVITQINGSDVRSASLGEVLSQFGEIDTTETFTLRILRWDRQEGNNKANIYEFDLTLTINVDEDHATVTFEVRETATMYRYHQTTSDRLIALAHSYDRSEYLRIENGSLAMNSSTCDQSTYFDIDLYQPSWPTRVCVVRNKTHEQVIDSDAPTFLRTATRDPPGTFVIANSKFFKWHTLDAFESMANPGRFLNRNSDGKFELIESTMENLPASAKFTVW